MGKLLRRIEEWDQAAEPGVACTAHGGGRIPVRERLSDQDVDDLVHRFRAGTPKHKLASYYGISLSSVKRLLKKAA